MRPTLAVLLMFLPFLMLAVVDLKILFPAIFLRNDTTFPEGVGVYAFLTTLRTGHLYSDPLQPPWNAQQYGPVFYLLGSVFAKLANGAPLLTTELMRSLSFMAFLGSAGLVGYLSWKLEGRRIWAATSIVLGLACVWAIPFCASVRADSLSIFFILAALAMYQVAQGRAGMLFCAGALGALGLLTKQNVAAVLLAVLLDSLTARRYRDAAALIAGSTAVGGLILTVLWLRHEPFLPNFAVIKHASVLWSSAIPQAVALMRYSMVSVIAVGIALTGVRVRWREQRYRAVLLAILLGCISNVAGLAILGSDANYFVLPWFLVILMVPAGLSRVEEWAARSILIPIGLTVLGCAFVLHQRDHFRQTPGRNLVTNNIGKLRLLSDWPYLELRSRDPVLLDPYFYHQLSLQGVWSIAPVLASIDKREYDLILINGTDSLDEAEFTMHDYRGYSNWGPEVLNTVQQNYQALCEVPGFMAFVPKDRSGPVREDLNEIFQQPCVATNRRLQIAPGVR